MTVRILGLRNKLVSFVTVNVKRVSDKFETMQFPGRLQGTIVEKWAKYWRQLAIDYKDVALDLAKDIRTKPIKAAVIGTIGTAGYLAAERNPDEEGFIQQIRLFNNDLVILPESCHNPQSAQHLKFLERCYNEGIVRRLTLGVVSFMWLDNYDRKVSIYKATCPYLEPEYLTFNRRIIDVGFWNRWWTLEKKMLDYDVNI